MGMIDRCTYTLTCEICKTSESQAVVDRGSGYGGSSWGHGPDFAKFDSTWTGGGGNSEPELKSATCKACGANAALSSRYTQ